MYSLSQYTSIVSRVVNTSTDLAGAWVSAELSDVRFAGGHCYMELIEKNQAGQTVAKMRANIWQSNLYNLRRKFFQATQRDIATGIKVLVRGSANHHSVYGLSFNITDIDPSYTLGDMERLRKEILDRLAKEGILNLNKERELPANPQRIAVISAQGAAGYGDFINQLSSNADGFVFYPCLFPCVMQGDRVASSIISAIESIESMADLWDCIAIVRGGGATTDLNGFDNYDLAKAVALCGLPVIVGIGHERDRNVLDDIAHTSVKTPTAVAAFFIDTLRASFDSILAYADKIRQIASDKMRGEEQHLATVATAIPQLALRNIANHKAHIKNIADRIPLILSGRIQNENNRLFNISSRIPLMLSARFNNENNIINSKLMLIQSLSERALSLQQQKIENLSNLINVLDPSNTLRRGYSITRYQGKAVTDPDDIPVGASITTTLLKGTITSTRSTD